MDKDRFQVFLVFTGDEVAALTEAALAYRRKPSQLTKIVILDWLKAARQAGFPQMAELVPPDALTPRKEKKDA